MKLNLYSNIFNSNKASKGGGLFLKGECDEYLSNYVNSKDNSIKIENNIFSKNIAINEGGSIYSDYSNFHLAFSKNNNITFNKAGIMGGGIYSLYPEDKDKLFNEENFRTYNNTVESNISNIESKPSYITLESENYDNEIISGDYIPLSFILYGKFGNILKDHSKYYSSITLKVILEENKQTNDDINHEKINYKLLGNVCSFNNGKI